MDPVSFSRAAVAHDHKLGGLKPHQLVLSLLWRSKFKIKALAELDPLQAWRTALPQPCQLLGHLPSCDHITPLCFVFMQPLLCVSAPLSFIRTLAMGLGSTTISSSPELELNYICKESCFK